MMPDSKSKDNRETALEEAIVSLRQVGERRNHAFKVRASRGEHKSQV